ncbi:MAG TPA: ATP-binding protein [Thermoanaerobaculia bacterium]
MTSLQNVGGSGPVFLTSPSLRLARHFDPEVDLLVYDPVLGTLGLIHLLPEKGKKLEAKVKRWIDQATYVRHLLLTAPDPSSLPLTVELVLVVSDEPKSIRQIEEALGEVARKTDFLEAIGVNLLSAPTNGETLSPEALRRAFPWLLRATRAWYESQEKKASATGTLTKIEIQNYRLPGCRALSLRSQKIHLVFGRNGSGKSSFVEALELVVTGTAERLLGEKDYTKVIRNRGAMTEPARVNLRFKGATDGDQKFEVEAAGLSNPLRRNLRAAAFRLDQKLMDRLTLSGDAQRAEILLQSFFPTESASDLAYKRAKAAAEKALSELPPVLREPLEALKSTGKNPESLISDQLAWLDALQNSVPADIAAACLPLPAATIETLGSLKSELAEIHSAWTQQPPTVGEAPAILGRIDEILKELRDSADANLRSLRSAKEGLLRVSGWQAKGGAGAGRDFLADLNGWLRRYTLVRLADQHCQLLETLGKAQQDGWVPDPGTVGPFGQFPAKAAELEEQRRQSVNWARERDELFQRITAVASGTGGAGKPPAEISRDQKRDLDTVGRWLLPPPTDPNKPLLLGQAIEEALNTDTRVQVGDVGIGTQDWAQPLLGRLARLEEACQALQEGRLSGGHSFQALRDTRERYGALIVEGENSGQKLLHQLQVMIGAMNELMALATPARWTYEDLNLVYETDSEGRTTMKLKIGEHVEAALRLNTAQLNLFTVALFLLCAVRADNPLGLLILDDPLQNMDELTVTMLARGLAKISRLWGKRWQLLLFFHGDEDCVRFRQEVPLTVYQLPWPEGDMNVLPSLYSDQLQTLDDIAGLQG